jgi:hypothetical protein
MHRNCVTGAVSTASPNERGEKGGPMASQHGLTLSFRHFQAPGKRHIRLQVCLEQFVHKVVFRAERKDVLPLPMLKLRSKTRPWPLGHSQQVRLFRLPQPASKF